METQEYFSIGHINKTHGLKGQMYLYIDFTPFNQIKPFSIVYIDIKGKKIPHFIQSFNQTRNDVAIFALEDVDHIDQAKTFLKKEIFLPKKLQPKPKKNDFSWFDIVGYDVQDTHYEALGKVLRIQEMPQQFIAYIQYQGKEVMFPLHLDFIVELSKSNKLLKTQLPEGLLEIYLD